MPEFSGTIAASIFLEILSKKAPEAAKKLHETPKPKPYAVTPLKLGGKYNPRLAKPGSRLTFRAAVAGETAKLFIEGLIAEPFPVKRLGGARVTIESIDVNVIRFGEVTGEGGEALRLDFHTPVRFSVAGTKRRRKPKFRLFPIPEHVFHSLMDHWNAYAGVENRIRRSFAEWVINEAVEVDYRLRPVTLHATRGRIFRGSVGYIIYRFNDPKYLDTAAKLLQYGTYMNVGTGRSIGLGVMTYRKA